MPTLSSTEILSAGRGMTESSKDAFDRRDGRGGHQARCSRTCAEQPAPRTCGRAGTHPRVRLLRRRRQRLGPLHNAQARKSADYADTVRLRRTWAKHLGRGGDGLSGVARGEVSSARRGALYHGRSALTTTVSSCAYPLRSQTPEDRLDQSVKVF